MLFHYAYALSIFQRSGTGYVEVVVFVLRSIIIDFSQNFSERALLDMKNRSWFQSGKSIDVVEQGTLK